MTDLPIPAAGRLKRPSWRDSRLLVGVVLILLATALGAKVVAAADDTEPMFVAAVPLKPGDRLDDGNLRRVDVQLGTTGTTYLSAARGVPSDTYVRQAVAVGLLVPSTAVGSRDEVDVQVLGVEVDPASARTLSAGSVVDVWVSPRDLDTTQERYLRATRLLERISVAGVPDTPSGFGGTSGATAVQLLVPTARIGEVIGASDQQARFTLVPVPGSPGVS